MDISYSEKVTGTGAAITIKPGFKPSYIKVINVEGLCTLEFVPGAMDAGKGYKVLTGIAAVGEGAATVSLHSFIASGGITINEDKVSFTIGTDTDINVSGEDLVVVAIR